ncbi:MAG: hypothetical protein KJZ86_10435 [Caldilineaceae bacterium]|nr:hypothetical protein [Caldilineaceae bacterium]HRJ42405.1 flagellar hook capping FlgD N-terminal domain-containing protein [Caldilineaceae bacterium]
MNTQSVGQARNASAGAVEQNSSRSLERDSFMQLLLLQMRSQDPMNPMDSAQMFNQMAQLTSLEQLWDIRDLMSQANTTQQLGQGAMLLGRFVEAASQKTGRVSGLVDEARMVSGQVMLTIGGKQVRLEDVLSVKS